MRTSTVLFIVGAVVLLLGIVVVGFGIPVQEFSFGNTLIITGATTATGGLIVVALGAVVSQLQRLNDALAQPMSAPAHATSEMAAPVSAGTPESHPFEPRGPSMPPEFPMPASPAPVLRNPEEPAAVAEDMARPSEPAEPEVERAPPRDLPAWMRQRPPQPVKDEPKVASTFDSMWPSENTMLAEQEAEQTSAPPEAAAEAEPAGAGAQPAAAADEPLEPPMTQTAEKPRAVAILKSGVVDGMGYTLYVDGSIEAELPQGTLRFASIHELRAHLEQNG
jgi:hypothetical protein